MTYIFGILTIACIWYTAVSLGGKIGAMVKAYLAKKKKSSK